MVAIGANNTDAVLIQQEETIEKMKKAIELALLVVVASSERPEKETNDFIKAAEKALQYYENLEGG